MSGVRRTLTSQDFKGGQLTAIMGGCEVDLRHASISGGTAVLDLFAFWGGIDIKVPQDWRVVVEGTPFLGGFEDKTLQQPGDASKRLVIRGTVIMGGAEITN
jgi:predicted membrane protein